VHAFFVVARRVILIGNIFRLKFETA